MTSLTTQSEYLVELSEEQQEVVSGGGYYDHKKHDHKKHGHKNYGHKKHRDHGKKYCPW